MGDVQAEVVIHSPGCIVMRWATTFVQVRSGEMTEEVLMKVTSAIRLTRTTDPRPLGYFGLLEETAELLSPEVREAQKDSMVALASHPRTFGAQVILGNESHHALLRTLSRPRGALAARTRSFDRIEDGVKYISDNVPITYPRMMEVVRDARRLVRTDPDASRWRG